MTDTTNTTDFDLSNFRNLASFVATNLPAMTKDGAFEITTNLRRQIMLLPATQWNAAREIADDIDQIYNDRFIK